MNSLMKVARNVRSLMQRRPAREKAFLRGHVMDLQDRNLLSASPLQHIDVSEWGNYTGKATAGDTFVVLSDMHITGRPGITSTLKSVTYNQVQGCDPLSEAGKRVGLMIDANNDGQFSGSDRFLGFAKAVPVNGVYTLSPLKRFDFSGDVHMGVIIDATYAALAEPKELGIELDHVTVSVNGKDLRPSAYSYSSSEDGEPDVTIVPQRNEVSLDLYLGAGASKTYMPGDQDVVLGELYVSTTAGAAHVDNLSIALQGRDQYWARTSVTDKFLNVDLRNAVTRQVVHTKLAFTGIGYEIVKAGNFTVNNGDRWDIIADISATTPRATHLALYVNPNTDPQSVTNFNGTFTAPKKGLAFMGTDADAGSAIVPRSIPIALGDFGITVAETWLNIIYDDSMPALQMVTKGSTDLVGLRFTAEASRASDVLLTSLTVGADRGTSLESGRYFELWADMVGHDGVVDTIVGTEIASADGRLLPIRLYQPILIAAGERVAFEVKFDARVAPMPMRMTLDSVTARKANGDYLGTYSWGGPPATLWTVSPN